MLKLLIAVDGSPASLRAIDTAARLGRDTPVEAVLLHVRDAPSYHGDIPPYDYERIAAAQRRHQDGVLESALAHATAAGLGAVQTPAELGTAAADIARVASDRRVDMIVIGTRGATVLGGLLVGSVAQRVVHLASVPVLLVK